MTGSGGGYTPLPPLARGRVGADAGAFLLHRSLAGPPPARARVETLAGRMTGGSYRVANRVAIYISGGGVACGGTIFPGSRSLARLPAPVKNGGEILLRCVSMTYAIAGEGGVVYF